MPSVASSEFLEGPLREKASETTQERTGPATSTPVPVEVVQKMIADVESGDGSVRTPGTRDMSTLKVSHIQSPHPLANNK
jgi:hypothetical protein